MMKFMGVVDWFSDRFPWRDMYEHHLSKYYAPKNFNFWYFFGGLAMLVLFLQLITGIWLAMFYVPTSEQAFASVEYIMRDVKFGWLLRYMHSTGASFFFIVVYLHMFRSLLYGSHKNPRELVWLVGMAMYMVLVIEAFMGYLLPWGQMSYWGAQVITSLAGAIPWVGDHLVLWIRGDYNISTATLGRFFALHVAGMPLLLLGLVWLHIVALHHVGSNNPDGIDIRDNMDAEGKPRDGIPFHPYYVVKDLFIVAFFLMLLVGVACFFPEMGGYFLEHANFESANPLVTPEYIAPVWYLTPYYAILRAVPDKLFGVLAMGAALLVVFFLPWLDRCKVRSIRYRGVYYKSALTLFVISFICLGYLGTVHVTPVTTFFARLFALVYFAFFLLMPLYTKYDRTKTPPRRVQVE